MKTITTMSLTKHSLHFTCGVLVVMLAAASTLSAATYAVGTCRPQLRSFGTIASALAASPSPNVVMVCPGIYNEQLQITQPVTLQGVSNGTSTQAVIAPPASGLVANDVGYPYQIAAQIWVNNVPSGTVNITNITVDASGNGVPAGPYVVGIFYESANGTVNRVAVKNQRGNGTGVGIWEGANNQSSNVTIENCSVQDYDYEGILLQNSGADAWNPMVTGWIKGNQVTSSYLAYPHNSSGIAIGGGGNNVTVTNNLLVNSGALGIYAGMGPDVISGNTVIGGDVGISIGGYDVLFGVSATANKIFGSSTGISVYSNLATVKSNTITNSTVGIDFQCTFSNVLSNIIMESGTALNTVPMGLASPNTYFNVGNIRTGC